MIGTDDLTGVIGGTLYGSDGQKIGKIGQVYLDDATGRPEWLTVHTGLFSTKETFVPLAEATTSADEVRVPYTKDQIKDAPNVDPEAGHLSEAEEAELFRYYGVQQAGTAGYAEEAAGYTDGTVGTVGTETTTGTYTGAGTGTYETAGTVGHDTSGPNTDDAMTRSEERVRVGTETVAAGRARLRKWVETEQETVTVPVRSERATLVTEPITDENYDRATSGPAISEEEHEVVLHAERPVVTTEAVPVERVRLDVESETTNEQVTEDVRKERIELEGDVDAPTRR
ncbi:DUF2382 domain-containing protein [Motilibacter aurantiacus]|uniref:DUF2382 domain-containing protein n=1 Tax=Motilibacter aurantiacus TaxID=2714955 RepID=UPI0014094914|nr:PRC and DUF2382 domain-containing protein [Motilibacter aurantiacus]NHC46025.1 PRC and DUF2382 domain-containing protein [Motilibacter aurantiacus]